MALGPVARINMRGLDLHWKLGAPQARGVAAAMEVATILPLGTSRYQNHFPVRLEIPCLHLFLGCHSSVIPIISTPILSQRYLLTILRRPSKAIHFLGWYLYHCSRNWPKPGDLEDTFWKRYPARKPKETILGHKTLSSPNLRPCKRVSIKHRKFITDSYPKFIKDVPDSEVISQQNITKWISLLRMPNIRADYIATHNLWWFCQTSQHLHVGKSVWRGPDVFTQGSPGGQAWDTGSTAQGGGGSFKIGNL